MIKNGMIHLFADWSVIINANICQDKGFDVYDNNPCDPWSRKHVYGKILLYFPYIDILKKIYFFYFPLLFNFIFILIVTSFFYSDKKYKNYTIIFFIFSASFVLAIERANIDIIIFLIIYFIAKYRNSFLNHFFIFIAASAKFYPLVLGVIFLFKKNLKTIFLNLIVILLCFFIIIFFQSENLFKILDNKSQFSGTGIYQFSIYGIIELVQNMKIVLQNKSFDWIKYFFVFLFLFLPTIVILIYLQKNIQNHSNLIKIFNEDIFENRLYISSSIIILFCYFFISNFIYREIFFLGLIPWFLRSSQKSPFSNFYFYIIVFKFLISSILVLMVRTEILISYMPLFTLSKHMIDFYLVMIVFFVFILNIYNFSKKLI